MFCTVTNYDELTTRLKDRDKDKKIWRLSNKKIILTLKCLKKLWKVVLQTKKVENFLETQDQMMAGIKILIIQQDYLKIL